MLGPKDKPALYQVRNYDDALRAAQHFFWNALIRCIQAGVNDFGGHSQPIN
jgi:hypothetical protein